MNIVETKKGGRFRRVLVMAVDGRLAADTSDSLLTAIEAAIERNEKAIVLDLGKLEYISSAGMRVVLLAAKRLEEDGKFAICGLNKDVGDVFRVSGFDSILDIFENETAALAALG